MNGRELLLGARQLRLPFGVLLHKPQGVMSKDSDEKVKGLIMEISSYLRKNRDSLPDKAVRLLEEAREELQRIRSDPPDDEDDLKAMLSKVALQLVRFFAKPETLGKLEQITDELGDLC